MKCVLNKSPVCRRLS